MKLTLFTIISLALVGCATDYGASEGAFDERVTTSGAVSDGPMQTPTMRPGLFPHDIRDSTSVERAIRPGRPGPLEELETK